MPHPIHHITAIASDPNQCVHFYTKVLGLRLVKKSVNQDQTEAYHLFFGDKTGEPGMDLTFFTFPGIGRGERGVGAVTTISLTVPLSALEFWVSRFDQYNVTHDGITEKFGTQTVTFYDPDNQRLELVGVPDEEMEEDTSSLWETAEVSQQQAIRSFDSAKLTVASKSMIENIVTDILGFEKVAETDQVSLYSIPVLSRENFLEIEEKPVEPRVYNASGTVHHIAFQVESAEELLQKRKQILQAGLYPTDVIDRYYFKSVYFRTPAGILFELATNGPGFTVDEAEETLGEKLALPPFLEDQRAEIEAQLEPLQDFS